ncbi:MAG TPA: adenylate/guanylate cyclase domain-containing protein [Flavisolibacter sp.]|jgi:class 3 adenylate cyclase/YHS domain-containing protein|nr:adenylate/guanylate cyclase domain-containing protein [Flavisolibacter sp.]
MEKRVGILMADLSGYTAMTEVHGDRTAMHVIDTYLQIAQRSLVGESILFERVGDQIVIISEFADDLANTALELLQNTKAESHFLSIHAGLHYGTVLENKGHFFGSTINLAARLATRAKENKILCSQDFIDALCTPDSFKMVPQGMIRFKNVRESKAIFELHPNLPAQPVNLAIDPVCHMHVDIDKNAVRLQSDEGELYFCSDECKQIYEQYHTYPVA